MSHAGQIDIRPYIIPSGGDLQGGGRVLRLDPDNANDPARYLVSHVSGDQVAFFNKGSVNGYQLCPSVYIVNADWMIRIYDAAGDGWHKYRSVRPDGVELYGAYLLPRDVDLGHEYAEGAPPPYNVSGLDRQVKTGDTNCNLGGWNAGYNPGITVSLWGNFNVCGFNLPAIYVKERGPQTEEFIYVKDVGLVWYRNPQGEKTWRVCEGTDGSINTCIGTF